MKPIREPIQLKCASPRIEIHSVKPLFQRDTSVRLAPGRWQPNYLICPIFVLMMITIVGCERTDGYPDIVITSPIGEEGVCVVCSKTIDSVSKDNLVTFGGNQFIVCDEACAAKAEAVTEHSH